MTNKYSIRLLQFSIIKLEKMSKKIFLIFEELGKLPPKIFRTQKTINKHKLQKPEYSIRVFDNEVIASEALMIYQVQHQKFLLNLQKDKITSRLQMLDPGSGPKEMISASNLQTEIKKNEIKSKQGLISIKTLQELGIQKQKFMNFTPDMPKLLHYHEPTAVNIPIDPLATYEAFFDGCSKHNPGPSGVGYYIKNQEQTILQGAWPLGTKTNNQAQFLAFLYLLIDSYINGIRKMHIVGDSRLVIQIAQDKWQASNHNIVGYAEAAKKVLALFDQTKLEHVDRKYNIHADKLANESLKKKFPKQSAQKIFY